MCEKYLYGSEGGAGNDRPYPYPRPQKMLRSFLLRERTGRSTKFDKEFVLELIDRPVCAARNHPA
jgi:hypothetical protein